MSIVRELSNKDVVEKLIRYEAQPSAFRLRDDIRVRYYTSVNGVLTGL